MQHCKSDSCRESNRDALACLDFQQYYYEKYINLSVWKGFKGCCIHLLPETEHLITDSVQQENYLFFSSPLTVLLQSLEKYKYWRILMKMTSTPDVLVPQNVIKCPVN